jgi:diadenosine tetraphosphate (Ap4A) HIT family hydrolase
MDGLMDKNEHVLGSSACPFCSRQTATKAVDEYGPVYAIVDANPVSDGHMLVITKRYVADFFEMTAEEQHDAGVLLARLRDSLLIGDPSIAGFNLGVNCGRAAGQTVMHVHVHLIPRRDGDTPSPRGGVRGVIPGKMGY